MAETRRVPGDWWGRSILAGILGGTAYALYKMTALWALGMGFWTALNALAAAFPAFRPTVHGFSWGPTLTGAASVLVVAGLWGVVLGWVTATYFPDTIRSWGGSTLLGLGWGLAAGVIVTLWVGPRLVPELVAMSPGNTFIGCVLGALVAHWALTGLTWSRAPAITFAPVEQERVAPRK